MSQNFPLSLPDTQTPNSQIRVEEIKDIWGKLVPRRPYIPTVDLSETIYSFGRNETCSISVSRKNMAPNLLGIISKEHFSVSRDSTNVPYIHDTSRNGTYLNGELIGKGRMSTLCTGDIIAIGKATAEIYEFRDESQSGTEYGKKYKETRLLGRGAFGEVYLAFSRTTCYRYAVKKIQKSKIIYGTLKSNDAKIENEIKILQALKHPCVIKMQEIIYGDDFAYIILEYMEGGELFKRIVKKRRLEENITKLYFYQITLALQYLHNAGITHRDLKPENILLATHDDITLVKVSDFGLSKIIDDQTVLKSLCGTPMYVAPEILINNGMGTYTQQVDVWSLGVILYCCLIGENPFLYGSDIKTLFYEILKGIYTVPEDIKASLSQDVMDMIQQTLIVDPKKRITVDEIFKHRWMKDNEVQAAFKTLQIEYENK